MRRPACCTLALAAATLSTALPATRLTAQRVTKDAAMPAAAGGAFVVRLGSDTLAVERFTRNANRVDGDIVNRSPMVVVTHYVADLDAAGRITRVEYSARRPDGSPVPNAAKRVTLTFRGDSVWSEVTTAADTIAHGAAAVPAGTIPSITNSYAMYEIALMHLRTARRSDGAVTLWRPGAPAPSALRTAFTSPSAATMDYFGDPVMFTTDAAGRILAVDGSRTTNKVMVERLATADGAAPDVASIARAFAARGAMGTASPRDTVRATVGAAQLWIDYSRPSIRGRTVWGGTLVPYNAIWRTGANGATQLSTSRDLVIGGTPVPAGTYTLWTWPTASGYQLVVNRQTKQWGTEYAADQDLARIPLTATSLAQPVEQFTFAIDATETGGTIRMQWGDRQLAVPFTVR